MPMVFTDDTVSGNPILHVSQSFIGVFGYSREKVLGRSYFFLTCF